MEQADAEVRGVLFEARNSKNVLHFCGADGRLYNLLRLGSILERCLKGLDEYLRAKRDAYPRFFFVAPPRLLQLLALAEEPSKLVPLLAGVFDGLGNLDFSYSDTAKRRISELEVGALETVRLPRYRFF